MNVFVDLRNRNDQVSLKIVSVVIIGHNFWILVRGTLTVFLSSSLDVHSKYQF